MPNSLHTLRFGNLFNQKIKKNILPKSLNTLILGIHFNQEIKEGVVPNSLLSLILGKKYDKKNYRKYISKIIVNFKNSFKC